MQTIVEVRNVGKLTYKLNFNRDVYEIKPRGSVVVNLEVAAYWLGDPRILNDRPGDRTRQEFFDRKRAQWSFALGSYTEEDWETLRPKLEVWSVGGEAPERVWMLLDDPDGTRENPAIGVNLVTADSNPLVLQAQLLELQRQQATLLQLVEQLQAGQNVAATVVSGGDANAATVGGVSATPLIPDPNAPAASESEAVVPVAPDDSGAKPDGPQSVPTGRGRGK